MLTLLAFLSLLVGAAGLAGAFLQLFSPFFGAAISAGAICMLGLLFFAALAQFLRSGNTSWVSLFLGLFSFAAVGAGGYFYFTNPIYDVTTDVRNPPKFVHPVYPFRVEKGGEYLEPSLQLKRDYDPALAAVQLISYPGFEGVEVKAPAKNVYEEAMRLIESQLPDWNVLLNDGSRFHAEIEALWSPYSFVNDIILEVRPVPEHDFDSRVELRSRSRWPLRSDFGVNIFRLRDLKVRLALVLKPLEQRMAAERAEWEKENAENAEEEAAASRPAAGPAPAPSPAPPPAADTKKEAK